jgi:transposase
MDERKRVVGHPSRIYRTEVRERIISALSKGATYGIAAGYGGIELGTLSRWMDRGRKMAELTPEEAETHPDKVYYDFYKSVLNVEALAALKWLSEIDRASKAHWQAAAWKLERRYPKDYGRILQEIHNEKLEAQLRDAQEEVMRLKGDKHGRDPQSSS